MNPQKIDYIFVLPHALFLPILCDLIVQAYNVLMSLFMSYSILVTQVKWCLEVRASLSHSLTLIEFAKVSVKTEPRRCQIPMITKYNPLLCYNAAEREHPVESIKT